MGRKRRVECGGVRAGGLGGGGFGVETGGMVSRSQQGAVIFRSKPVLFLIDMSLPVDRFGWVEWG